MIGLIYLIVAFSAAVLLLFPSPGAEIFLLHLLSAIWAGIALFVLPPYVVHWYHYRRQQVPGWRKHGRSIVQATLFGGWFLLVTMLSWPQYNVWFGLLP